MITYTRMPPPYWGGPTAVTAVATQHGLAVTHAAHRGHQKIADPANDERTIKHGDLSTDPRRRAA